MAVFLSVASANAVFAHNFEVDGIYYNFNSDGTSVRTTFKGSTYNEVAGEYTGNVEIPAKVTYLGKSYAVTEIGFETFRDCTGITSVVIPNSVTRINYSAFCGCSNLKSLTIPETVTYIGHDVFFNCTSLTSLTIPGNVEEIGSNAFYGCKGLKSMTIPQSVTSLGSAAFYGCSNLEYVSLPNSITKIEDQLFVSCYKLTSVILPNAVTAIGFGAFQNCSNLTKMIIPNSVTEIGGCAFYDCRNLESVKLSENIKIIGNSAFYDCYSLKSAIIPNSVTTIGERCFRNCPVLTSITIGNSVKEIGRWAFDCDSYLGQSLTKVNISSIDSWCGIKFEESQANPLYFAHHLYLNGNEVTNLEIPETVTSISDYAFVGCTGLKTVSIPTSVTAIGSHAFEKSGITSVEVPNSVKNIGTNAFANCEELQTAVIPNSIVEIPKYLFQNSSQLKKVSLPNTINTIGYSTFYGCTNLSDIEIPNSVTVIEQSAFEKCSNLSSIVIPNSVKTLNSSAFSECTGLTSVSISENLEELKGNTFANCTSLKSVVISDKITKIAGSDFAGCTSLEEVTIGKSVKEIGDYTFSCVRLMKINCLSKTAPRCGNYTFNGVRTDKCQLVVPIGYKDSYTANSVWNTFTNISEDIFDNEDTDLERYENVLFVKGSKGVAGLNTTLSLMLNNTIEAVGFQCDFYAPEKSCVPKDEDGFYMMDLSTERTTYSKTNLFETGLQADGAIRILCSSSKNYAFSGTTGEVATITLSLDKDIAPGEYPLVLKNIVISNPEGRTYKVPYVKTTLTVESFNLGDANGDGEVNIGDYTTIASHILGKPQDAFMETAADTNQDGTIDVGDLTGLVKIILSGNENKALSVNTDYEPLTSDISEYDNVIYALDSKIGEDGFATVSVNMKNSVEVPGYQFDIVLPEELEVPVDEDEYYQIELSTARTTPKKTNLFETALQTDGSIRVLCGSTKIVPFKGNDGEVCTIKVKFKDAVKVGDYTITLKNIVISDTDGKTFKVDKTTATITADEFSFADIITEDSLENAEIYSIDGVRRTELQHGVNIVKYSSGKIKKVFVK